MTTRRIRTYSFLIALSLGLFSAIDVIYMLWLDMTWVQIGTLAAAFNIAVLVAEIPSSVLADVFSARITLIIGLCARCTGLITFAMGADFYTLCLAEVMAGLGMAMTSGSFDKVLISSLPDSRQETISSAFGSVSRFSNIGNAVGVVVGVAIFSQNPRMTWALAALGLCACIALAWGLSDSTNSDSPRPSLGEVVRGSLRSVRNPALWISVVAASSGVAPFLLWQRLVSVDGLQAVAIVGVLISAAGWSGARLESTAAGQAIRLEFIVLANAALVSALGWIDSVIATCALFLVHVVFQTMMSIRVYGLFQASVPHELRATMTSLSSLGDSAIAALGTVLTGLVMARFGAGYAMLVSVTLYALLLVMLLARRPIQKGRASGM